MNDIVGLRPVPGYHSVFLTDNVSASLYYLPETPIPATFWRLERQILTGILMYRKLYKDNVPPIFGLESVIARHIPVDLAKILEIEPFDKPIHGVEEMNNRYSDTVQDIFLKKMPLLMDMFSDKYAKFYVEALVECIQDYVSESDIRKYMLVLHKPMDPNNVFMTMSIRMYENFDYVMQFEHRHIIKSVRSTVGPLLTDTITPAPARLSMLMHTTSLKFMKELHPDVSRLFVHPLTSMYNIFVKSGFAKPLTEKEQRYDAHSLTLTGNEYERLLHYFDTAREMVQPGVKFGLCVQCQNEVKYKCGLCEQPLVCKNTTKCYTGEIDHDCIY